MHSPLLQPQKDTGKGACGPPDPHCPLSRYSSPARFIYEPVHELVEQLAQLCGGESGAIGAGLQEAQVVVDGRVGVTPLDMIDGVGAHGSRTAARGREHLAEAQPRAHGARVPRAGIRAEGRQARPRLYRSALHGGRDATAQTPGGINLTVTVTVSTSNFSTFHARKRRNFYFFKLHFTFLYKSTSEIYCSLLLLLPSSPFHFAFYT